MKPETLLIICLAFILIYFYTNKSTKNQTERMEGESRLDRIRREKAETLRKLADDKENEAIRQVAADEHVKTIKANREHE